MSLSPRLTSSDDSRQQQLLKIRGWLKLRVLSYDVCYRPTYAFVYRGGQKGVYLARMRPVEYDCHTRDLPFIIDLVSHGCVEVGTCRKQRIKVDRLAIFPDQCMGPAELRVQRASHHLALVVDACAQGENISRQGFEDSECLVLPKSGIEECAVTDCANNLAFVVNPVGLIGSRKSEVRKRGGIAIFPNHSVIH